MFGIGAGEFILILIVGLIVFGPSKLPEFGRSLGKLIRELKKTQATLSNAINLEEPPKPANTSPATTSTASTTPTASAPTTQTTSTTQATSTTQTTPTTQTDSNTSNTTATNQNISNSNTTTTTNNTSTPAQKTTSTQELIQIADSNPIRLDKGDSTVNLSKESFDK